MQVRFISLVWGIIFVGSGLFKVLMLPEQEQLLMQLGFPGWMLVIIGVSEVIFGALVLSPRWRAWGSLAIAVEMVIAAVAHLVSGALVGMVLANAALFAGAVYLLVKERSNLFSPPRELTDSVDHGR